MSLPIITTIQTNINNLKSTKTDIKNAVNTDYDFIANEQIESYPGLIKQGIAYYKNRVPHATKEGTDLSFNAVPLKFENMTIKGNTEQASYTGKNMLNKNTIERGKYCGYGIVDNVPVSSSASSRATISPNNAIKVNPSTSYTITFPSNFRFALGEMDENYISLGDSGWKTDTTYTSTTKSNTQYIGFNFSKSDNTSFSDNDWSTFINSNIQLEEGSTATDYEPYVGGIPSPNPDYPQDIHVVTGENVIKNAGKNLWGGFAESYSITSNGINFVTNTDGSISARGTSTGQAISGSVTNLYSHNIYKKLSAGTYTVTKSNVDVKLEMYNSQAQSITTIPKANTSSTFTLLEETTVIIRLYILSGDTIDETTYIQLEKSSTATSYEPYYHQDYPLNLGSIELCKIGEYQDYLYKENGNWYKYNAINKYVYNNDLTSNTVTENKIQMITPTLNITGELTYSQLNQIAYCNMMKATEVSYTGLAGTTSTNKIRISMSTSYVSDYTEFRALCASKNLTIYYATNSPTTTQITDETLISQLNAIDKAKGNNGTTIITSTGTDLAPILNFTAYLKEVE